MMEVGIRELRQRLASILDEVDRGATITITDRGRPRAVLRPACSERALDRGMREGWISAGPGYGAGAPLGPPLARVRSRPGVRAADIRADDRGSH